MHKQPFTQEEAQAMYDALKSLELYTKVIELALTGVRPLVPLDAPIAYIRKAYNTIRAVDNGEWSSSTRPRYTVLAGLGGLYFVKDWFDDGFESKLFKNRDEAEQLANRLNANAHQGGES